MILFDFFIRRGQEFVFKLNIYYNNFYFKRANFPTGVVANICRFHLYRYCSGKPGVRFPGREMVGIFFGVLGVEDFKF